MIIEACDEYDILAVRDVLTQLRAFKWPKDISDSFEEIDKLVRIGEYEEAAAKAEMLGQ